MKIKFSPSVLLVALCSIPNVASERGSRSSLPEATENRALNDKGPPKTLDIPGVRRYHEWQYSGSATNSQYANTNRAGHRGGSHDDDDHYEGDDDGYYYGPAYKGDKRPSETETHYMVKMPKRGKHEKGKGGGKGGKNEKTDKSGSSSEDCYYVYEDEYNHDEDYYHRLLEEYWSEEYHSEEYYESEDYHSEEYHSEEYESEEYHSEEYEYEPGHTSKGSKGGGYRSGKYPKSRKSSKSGKRTKICKTEAPSEITPTVSPYPTGSNDMPSERPPAVAPSPFTPSPTNEDSVAVTLPAFALEYDVPESQPPLRRELEALEAATNLYLENFFFEEFDGNTFTILDDFVTELLDSNFNQGRPIEVDYESTARFNPFSTIIPTEAQLNAALIDAFSGLNMLDYEVFLNDELPEGNIFIGSTVLFIQDSGSSSGPNSSGVAATSIAAAAVAFTLLVAGIVLYKRRRDGEESDMDKLNKPSGGATVAGETFTGETYDGTASISAASMEYIRKYRDEEDESSKSMHNLGTIPETDDTWGANNDADGKDEEANVAQTERMASTQSNQTFGNGDRAQPFEDIALQPMQGSISSSKDESSQLSSSEHALDQSNRIAFNSTPSYDSTDSNSQSAADALSVRDNSARRPRTVSEIEALLSSGLGRDDDDSVTSDASGEDVYHRKPRTVEEIESLLRDDLEDDSTLELPFSDEDDTIDDA